MIQTFFSKICVRRTSELFLDARSFLTSSNSSVSRFRFRFTSTNGRLFLEWAGKVAHFLFLLLILIFNCKVNRKMRPAMPAKVLRPPHHLPLQAPAKEYMSTEKIAEEEKERLQKERRAAGCDHRGGQIRRNVVLDRQGCMTGKSSVCRGEICDECGAVISFRWEHFD